MSDGTKLCECINWAREACDAFPEHHPNCPKRETLHVFEHSEADDFVVAASVEDAWAVWLKCVGLKRDDEEAEGEFVQWRDDRELSINEDDGRGARRQTCAAWAAEQGRGFLCSRNY